MKTARVAKHRNFQIYIYYDVVRRANIAPAGGGGVLLWQDKGGGPQFPDSILACDDSNSAVYGRCVARLSPSYSSIFQFGIVSQESQLLLCKKN
jgi:hypothetical protein